MFRRSLFVLGDTGEDGEDVQRPLDIVVEEHRLKPLRVVRFHCNHVFGVALLLGEECITFLMLRRLNKTFVQTVWYDQVAPASGFIPRSTKPTREAMPNPNTASAFWIADMIIPSWATIVAVSHPKDLFNQGELI